MLVVREGLHNLLNVDRRMLTVGMSLARETSHVDQHVGIRDYTRNRYEDVVVKLVEFSTLTSWNKEGAYFFLLSSEDNSVSCEDANNGGILIDMLNSILNLK